MENTEEANKETNEEKKTTSDDNKSPDAEKTEIIGRIFLIILIISLFKFCSGAENSRKISSTKNTDNIKIESTYECNTDRTSICGVIRNNRSTSVHVDVRAYYYLKDLQVGEGQDFINIAAKGKTLFSTITTDEFFYDSYRVEIERVYE